MRNLAIGLFGLTLAAGTASAIDVSYAPITGGYSQRAPVDVFESVLGNYSAFPASSGILGIDDYASVATTSPNFFLAQLRFVGGVTAAGGILDFTFFDAAGAPVNGFGIALPQGGNFIWTISFGTPANNNDDSTFAIPHDGFMQISARNPGTGQWFLTPNPTTLGADDPTVGFGPGGTSSTPAGFNYAFTLRQTPAPASLGLLGLGGLLAARRRR